MPSRKNRPNKQGSAIKKPPTCSKLIRYLIEAERTTTGEDHYVGWPDVAEADGMTRSGYLRESATRGCYYVTDAFKVAFMRTPPVTPLEVLHSAAMRVRAGEPAPMVVMDLSAYPAHSLLEAAILHFAAALPQSREERLAAGKRRMRALRESRKTRGVCIDCEANSPNHPRCEPCRRIVADGMWRSRKVA